VAYENLYRLSAHAVITDGEIRVLLLKSTFGARSWELPGGALDPGETIHECIERECEEELGQRIRVVHLTGVYYHRVHNSHAFIFRAELPSEAVIVSREHSAFRYFSIRELSHVQRRPVEDCLVFNGQVISAKF
jgi:8-oxo-dGTP diphosphatase